MCITFLNTMIMGNKRRVLNIFPKPDNLTELSILSFYEIILYLAVFYFFYYVYTEWTTIPTKIIELNCERIDNHNVYQYHYELGPTGMRKITDYDKLANSGIDFHAYVMTSTVNIEQSASYQHWFSRPYIDYISKDRSCISWARDIQNYNLFLDSLNTEFYNRYSKKLLSLSFSQSDADSIIKADTIPVFYQNIKLYQNTKRLHHSYSEQIDSICYRGPNFLTFIINNNQKDDSTGFYKTSLESIFHEGMEYSMAELDGIFDRPRRFDLFDISQCYYKFIIKSQTIDTVRLFVHFYGANDFTFVETKPYKIDCQTLEYKIPSSLNQQRIILYVKSKELEVVQSTRLFFITAILSGLIVIFLTFVVIFLYRLMSWSREKVQMNNKRKKDNVAEKDNTKIKNKDKNKLEINKTKKEKQNKDGESQEERKMHISSKESLINNMTQIKQSDKDNQKD